MNPWNRERSITRRRFGTVTVGACASVALGLSCGRASGTSQADDGRLTVRPRSGVTTVGKGAGALSLDAARDAILHLPANAPAAPLPLLVLLHGAGGSAEGVLRRIRPVADELGVALLAPTSRGPSWDAIREGFGPDVAFLNRALERVFATVAVDPARLGVGGFSDGATYALSLGLINGLLFPRIVAFSPGFVIERSPQGQPRVFISHGTNDDILPIDRCSRRIVPALQKRGYDVTFREFDGGHEVPATIAREGLTFLAERGRI